MRVPFRLVLSAALLTLIALPAVPTAGIAEDHDHHRVDRDGDRGDHNRGDKSHFSREQLKPFLAEDRRTTGGTSGGSGGHYGAVPGPIAGAGLPILALGYGAYWLIRRYRRKPN
jgi:hypothetical protein